MKTPDEIQLRINTCEVILEKVEKEYSALNQIDMQSAEGTLLMDMVNQMTGQVTALNWMLEKHT